MLELPPRAKSVDESIPREEVSGIGSSRTLEDAGSNADQSQRSTDPGSKSQFDDEPLSILSRIVQWLLDLEKSTSASSTTTPQTTSSNTQTQPFNRSLPSSTSTYASFCRKKCHLLLSYGIIIGLLVIYHAFNLIGALSTTDSIAIWFSIILNFIAIITLVTISTCSPLTIILGSSFVERQHVRNRNGSEDDESIDIDLHNEENEVRSKHISNNNVVGQLSIYLSRYAMFLLSTDATTTRMLWGSMIACLVNLLGEVIFIHKGWVDAQERAQQQDQYLHEPEEGQVPYNEQKYDYYETESQTYHTITREMVLLVVYMASALTVSIILTLGSGYVALVHNMLAFQLECLVQLVNQQATSKLVSCHSSSESYSNSRSVDDDEEEESSMLLQGSRMLSSPSRNGNLKILRLPQIGNKLHSEFCHIVTPRVLFEVHNEFRHRIDSLKGLHRRFALVLATACLVTIILVSQGYIEQQSKTGQRIAQTPNLVVALLATFYGLSYSLWSMVFAVGRVVHVSRERVGYEVKRWALVLSRREQELKPSPSLDSNYRPRHLNRNLDSDLALDVAQYVSSFPIRFHIAIFEFGEDSIKAVMLLLFGLAAAFLGIHIPEIL